MQSSLSSFRVVLAFLLTGLLAASCGGGSGSSGGGGPDEPSWVSLTVDPSGGIMVLSFASGGGEAATYYRIQRREFGDNDWVTVAGSPATASPFQDVGPFGYGVPYEYRLLAGNGNGESGWVVASAVPVPVPTVTGEVLSWGANAATSLELGRQPYGQTDPTPLPIDTDVFDDAVAVSAGYGFSLVLQGSVLGSFDNELWAFGINTMGQVGNDAAVSPSLPVQPSNATAGFGSTHRVVDIAAGRHHALAVTENVTTGEQRLWGWGSNDRGQIGFDPISVAESSFPIEIQSFRGTEILGIAAGGWHSAALVRIGGVVRLYTWGDDTWGQLGLGYSGTSPAADYTHIPSLVTTQAVGELVSVSAGGGHTLALTRIVSGTSGGRVLAWGLDGAGQLGDGGTASGDGLNYPQDIGLSLIAQVDAGDEHSAAMSLAGGVYVWGGLNGALAPPANPALEDAVTITCGSYFVLAVLEDGRVKGLGDNTYGQLTHDPASGTFTSTFVTAPGLAGASLKLSGGGMHVLAFEE